MKRVIVTGANGFIGFHCLAPLVAAGYEVHAITSHTTRPKEPLTIIWHTLDLLDSDGIQKLFSKVKPTHLLHFAWITEHGTYWNSLKNYDWLKGSITILQKFAEAGGKRIVMAGTCAEYDWRYGYCSEQITPLNPKSVYGCCKNCMQQLAALFCNQTDLSWAWGRIFFLYGPRENPLRLVPFVINRLLQNRKAQVTLGTQIRDYLYVKDVAGAFVKVLESQFIGPLNIASGRALSVRDVAKEIAGQMGGSDLIQFGGLGEKRDEHPVILADTRCLVENVGWEPEYDLNMGIAETISYWKNTSDIDFTA